MDAVRVVRHLDRVLLLAGLRDEGVHAPVDLGEVLPGAGDEHRRDRLRAGPELDQRRVPRLPGWGVQRRVEGHDAADVRRGLPDREAQLRAAARERPQADPPPGQPEVLRPAPQVGDQVGDVRRPVGERLLRGEAVVEGHGRDPGGGEEPAVRLERRPRLGPDLRRDRAAVDEDHDRVPALRGVARREVEVEPQLGAAGLLVNEVLLDPDLVRPRDPVDHPAGRIVPRRGAAGGDDQEERARRRGREVTHAEDPVSVIPEATGHGRRGYPRVRAAATNVERAGPPAERAGPGGERDGLSPSRRRGGGTRRGRSG